MATNETPVYIFTGFLESGKTKFITETLEDSRFAIKENTLLLVCEQGEEEYDEAALDKKNISVEYILNLIQRKSYSVVCNTPLRIIVGSYAFTPVTCSDL